MKVKLKAALLSLSAILAISATSFSTMAYLTSEDTVSTAFTVGDVTMTLVESATQRLRSDGTLTDDGATKLVPNYEYRKDITVNIAPDSEVSWIFVQVDNGIAPIEAADGTLMADGTEYKSITTQMRENGWVPLMDAQGNAVTDIYVYNTHAPYYKDDGIYTAIPVFSYFKINSAVNGGTAAKAMEEDEYEEGQLYIGDYLGKTIEVTAYAVQAEGLESAAEAWSTVFAEKVERLRAEKAAAELAAEVADDADDIGSTDDTENNAADTSELTQTGAAADETAEA